jgi:hypothetical protein
MYYIDLQHAYLKSFTNNVNNNEAVEPLQGRVKVNTLQKYAEFDVLTCH